MSTERIGVAIPTHGRPEYFRRALASVLSQTRRPDQIVVSEDGEDPAIAALVEALSGEVPVLHVRNEPSLGLLENQRQAFALTDGELFAILHDDDEWEPNFLERTSAALVSHPHCGFCSTDHYLINEQSQVLVEASQTSSKRFGRTGLESGVYDDVLARHLSRTTFSLHSTLFRRDVIEGFGFLPSYGGRNADFALFLELGERRIPGCYLNEYLGRYRVHSRQETRDRTPEGTRATLTCLQTIGGRDGLTGDERRILARRYRGTVIELAIEHAHQRERRNALQALSPFAQFGWGLPRPSRIAVLIALLLGFRRPAGPSPEAPTTTA